MENGNYEKHAEITNEYLKKGIARIILDENNEESIDFKFRMYSKLINLDGFIVVGDKILQYTDSKYKKIRSRDYTKIETLKSIENNISNEDYYVTNINSTTKTSWNAPYCNIPFISRTIDNKKIVMFEFFANYDPNNTGIIYVYYEVSNRAEKKQFITGWVKDSNANVWLYGSCNLNDGDTNPSYSKESNNVSGGATNIRVFDRTYPVGHLTPSIPTSNWTSIRTGGPSGIWVNVVNHITQTTNP